MSINSMDDISIRIKENYKWIYTYDYAPDSVWDEWRSEVADYAWIQEEAGAVTERLHEDLPCYILLSDSHYVINGTWDDTMKSMMALSERITGSKKAPFAGIIHLGDLTDGLLPLEKTRQFESRCIQDMQSLNVPLYIVPGNHDYNYFRGNPEVKYPDRPQYYVDFEDMHLRMLFIDSFDPREVVRYGFTEYCIHWLDAALNMMPADYKAIIFSHVTPLVRLQAWAKDIRNRQHLIEVLNKHAEKILAFINGHNHCDHLFNDLNNGQFPIISINCAKCEYFLEHKPEGAVVPERRLGDRTQESFDIMQVDVKKRKIYFTRFGAGSDRYVENHKAYWV
ncbi:metallophosphoesterase family protein [Butyrivibrio sp. LC3010]|uniref:metallophosphoesterase family protein n=1 Tax=Butyrivibrio sp. LC3010 TaxID=1280680 RepID=UPI0004111B1D|nr:metallophosphoesterase [Butyrivibrio sp. LC3010]